MPLASDLWAFLKVFSANWFAGMCGALGVGLTCAEPFVSSATTKNLLFATAGVAYLAAAFAAWRGERDRADALARQVASQGRLEIDFVPGGRLYEERHSGIYRNIRTTLSVRVANVGRGTVGQVRLYALSVEPNEGNLAEPVLLPHPLEDLSPGDFRFRRIASYTGPGDHTAGDTMGTLHIPFQADHRDGARERTIACGTPYTVTLRATGDGAASPCDRRFRLRITAASRLVMEAANE